MESTLPRKQYPVLKPGSTSPGWGGPQSSDCESLRDYTDSGLCPVLLDDVLSGLDLMHNERPDSGQYLALKVLRLQYSTLDNSEMSILRKLEKLESAFFYTHAPTQGRFLCLGLKPLGCTLRERYNAEVDAPRDLPSLTTLVKTLLGKVLDFHQKGICHGDISPNNVSLGVHAEAFGDDALHQTFEYDTKSHVRFWGASNLSTTPSPPRPANLPEYIIIRYETPLKTNAQDMSLVDIIDFGKGFEAPSKTGVLGTDKYYAPELDCSGPNTATAVSDLWSLGCVFAYALTYRHLFELKSDLAEYLASDNKAQLSFIESQLSASLEGKPEYLHLFARFIHSLVRIDPEERDTEDAKGILQELEAWGPSN
ncbi:hypothetical protein FQN54_002343 [Arachnomyces sp. PD_36]|nr:hypothetical protein FQN54_002343 [Arachnomyces sp. PD_36]